MNDDQPIIRALQLGQLPRKSDQPIITAAPGRRCPCGTKLSVANLDTECAACQIKAQPRRAW